MEITLLKLGGSIITEKTKSRKARLYVIKKLVEEIYRAWKKIPRVPLIIGNGAGSFGHPSASRFKTHKGIVNRKSVFGAAIVSEGVTSLNALVTQTLVNTGIPAFSLPPRAWVIKQGTGILINTASLEHFLSLSMVPVVCGDVIGDTKHGFSIISTEELFLYLVAQWAVRNKCRVKRVIMVTDVDGIYSESKKIYTSIDEKIYARIKKDLPPADSFDVTGGIAHKIACAFALAREGCQVLIINGNKRGRLYNALLNKPVVGSKIVLS